MFDAGIRTEGILYKNFKPIKNKKLYSHM